MMTRPEAEIKASLMALLTGIKSSHGATIAAEMERLDGLLAAGRATLHPQLVHFLEKRSYAKAAMFLGGESDIPVGLCGGRAGPGRVNVGAPGPGNQGIDFRASSFQ